MTYPHSNKHVVPTAVLTRSRLVPLNAARPVTTVVPQTHGNPQQSLKDKGVIDSGCSRHITGNISYLSDFEEINGGYVAFDGNPKCGKITGKETEYVVLSSDLTCLFAKATLDEFNLWHRRLGHINFKTINKVVKGNGPTWLFDIDTLTQSMNYQPIVARNQPNSSIYPHNTDANTAFDGKGNESEVIVSPSSCAKPKKHDEMATKEAKGTSHVDLSTGVKDLSDEFEEFSVHSTTRVNATNAPVTAVGPNSTNSTNNFNAVSPSDNAVSSNFKIGGKSSFVDPSQYPNDPNIPALKDIVYSDDEEDVGAEADFFNLETSIIGSPILTTRVHKDHLVTQIIGDLSLAPQTKSMERMVKEKGGLTQINNEDFHTCMFACFLSQVEPKRVHQALKDPSWIEAMQEELIQFKMQKVWILVDLLKGKRAIGSKWEEGINYEEVFAPVERIEAIRLFIAYASFMGFMVYPMDVKSAFLYGTIEEEVYVCQPPGFEDPDYPDKTVVATSSNKAEYVAAASCYAQVLWLQKQLLDYGLIITVVSYTLMLFGLTNDVVHLILLDYQAQAKGQEVREGEANQTFRVKEIKEGGKITELDADKDVTLEDVDAEVAMDANTYIQDTNEAEPADVKEVLEVVTAAKLMIELVTTTAPITTVAVLKASAPRRRRGVVIQDPEETAAASVIMHSKVKSKDKGKGILIEEPKPLKRQAQIDMDETFARQLEPKLNTNINWNEVIEQARKNMMIYLKNMVGFKMNFFKGTTYSEIRPIFEKHYNSIKVFLEKGDEEIKEEGSKRKGNNLKEEIAKKQRIDEDAEELKRHLQINFDREDLETLWKLVKERFESTKQKNFSDDFLLNTLKIMFEKPNVEANVWRDQKGIYGLAKVKSLKMFESYGFHIITLTTTQMILLVKKKYPLIHFTLEQILNKVRLEVKEESKMSLELLSDRGTHFCNDQFEKVMLIYGVTHRLSTVYHRQTSGQVKVSNHGLRRILERTVCENRASWSDKLDDALCAFCTAFKTPIECTPYKLMYGKAFQMNELNELYDQAYKNSLIYKEKMKKIHDSKIKNRVFNVGDRVLLFNSRLKIFSGKIKTHWTRPFTVAQVFPYGTVELSQTDGPNFKVNGHRIKHYFGGDIPPMVVVDL
nr:reverse transcriptase domain-containing protein [Tanacetum cinerariifolium]